MKRLLSAVLTVIFLLILLSVSVSANSPATTPFYIFFCEKLPAETAYVDMLIVLPETDEHYVPLVEENLPEGFTAQSQIVTYRERDYCSYTFHYKDAKSDICLDEQNSVIFFAENRISYQYNAYKHEVDVENRGKIRLAMLDENGNILKVSHPLSLEPRELFGEKTNEYVYYGDTDRMVVESYTNFFAFFLTGVCIVLGLIITVIVEWIVSQFFKVIKTYGKTVIITNVLSQCAMWFLFLIFQEVLPWGNLYTMIILEVLVYTTEFFVYQKFMPEITRNRVLLFTVIGNTASLIIGPILIMLILS